METLQCNKMVSYIKNTVNKILVHAFCRGEQEEIPCTYPILRIQTKPVWCSKKQITIAFVCMFCTSALANSVDSLKNEIVLLRHQNAEFAQRMSRLESVIASTKEHFDKQNSSIDSVRKNTIVNASTIKQTADDFEVELKSQEAELANNVSIINESVSNKTAFFAGTIVLLIILIVAYFLFARKKSLSTEQSIKMLKDAQQTLEEQSIKLDSQLIDILEKKMKNISEGKPVDSEPDHSLPLKVADEIVRIQNNIDRMDASDKNVLRLNKALERMKTSFTAYGYEIVDMRGQEYTDNMPFEARFIPDDEIEEGKRVISGMDRLMVRYNGKMIQAPILAVRQNV